MNTARASGQTDMNHLPFLFLLLLFERAQRLLVGLGLARRRFLVRHLLGHLPAAPESGSAARHLLHLAIREQSKNDVFNEQKMS